MRRGDLATPIDRDALVKAVLFGNGKPANSLLPPQVPYYDASTRRSDSTTWPRPRRRWPSPACRNGFSTTILVSSGFSDDLTIATDPAVRSSSRWASTSRSSSSTRTRPTRPSSKPRVRHGDDLLDDGHPGPRRAGRRSPSTPTVGRAVLVHLLQQPRPWSRTRTTRREIDGHHGRGRRCTSRSSRTTATDAYMAYLYYSPYAYATTDQRAGLLRHAARQLPPGGRLAE